jgi:hypothetical protein
MSVNTFSGSIRDLGGNFRLGDDIINHYHNEARKDRVLFEKMKLQQDHFKDYVKPCFADAVIARLQAHRVICIGGNYGFNKVNFVQYIAFAACKEEQEIKECANIENFHSLSATMHEETRGSILILHFISAKKINYRFKELWHIAQKRNHTVIISTEEPYDSWRFEEDARQTYWFDIPEKNLYSRKDLLGYVAEQLDKNDISIEYDRQRIIDELSTTEEIDRFIDRLSRHKGTPDKHLIENSIRACKNLDTDSIQKWFDNLSSQHKLIVIGIALLEGAYENQFFAGFERILSEAWRKRDPTLKSIDYEDLIPFSSFYKTDGTSIRSVFREQRRKIIKLAWFTHKRYILAALPILCDIVIESVNPDISDWELFFTDNYRVNIRNVISETLSDIGLHSFEDVESALLQLAAHPHIYSQIVAAEALSKWRTVNENKIYQVLDRWQQNAAVHRLMQSYLKEGEQREYRPLAHIDATVLLTLYFVSLYERNGYLASNIKDLLLRSLNSKEKLVVKRMQLILDLMITSHPDSMAELLKTEFLNYQAYIDPVATGLAYAYHNGFSNNVKIVIEDWMKFCDERPQKVEDPESFTKRDKILSAVILFLGQIDYSRDATISVKYAYDILENYRKSIHKHTVREYLLNTIVDIIEANFYMNESISIDMISNIDKSEREYLVKQFVKKYLQQRALLKGGDYELKLNDEHSFESWANPQERPETQVELLLKKWKKSSEDTLSQIALKSFVEIDRIEATERQLIEEHDEQAKKRREQAERRKKELEEMGRPIYDGNITANAETIAFVKLCKRFIRKDQEKILQNISILILQDRLTAKEAEKLIYKIDDPSANDTQTEKNIFYVYQLFRNEPYKLRDHPLNIDFRDHLYYMLSFFATPAANRKLLKAFAPFLMKTALNSIDIDVILTKINPNNRALIRICYYLCRYPVLLMLLILFITYLLSKIF